jgi:hypothetical protein
MLLGVEELGLALLELVVVLLLLLVGLREAGGHALILLARLSIRR